MSAITGDHQPQSPLHSPWYVASFGADYAERYAHRDDAEAARAVAAVAPQIGCNGARVLDLCCGMGRHVRPLLDAGAVHVTGVDLSGDLLALATDRLAEDIAGRRVMLLQSDMRSLPVPDCSLDAVASFFTSFGYFDDEADDRRVLREVARVLKQDGRFAFDFMNAGHTIASLVPRDTIERGGVVLTQVRHYDPASRRIEKRVTDPAGREVLRESVRAWTPHELLGMAADAGLHLFMTLGDYAATPFDPEASPRFIAVFRKSPACSG